MKQLNRRTLPILALFAMSTMAGGCAATNVQSAWQDSPAYIQHVEAIPAANGNVMSQLRVMSFNLRRSTPLDLYNSWGFRKQLVAKVIKQFDPDILGTQECLEQQASYLRNQLPEYQFVGVGRNNGRHGGEMCALFFKRDKFILLDQGAFWLSDTPERVGSQSWLEIFPRAVTWIELRPKASSLITSAKPFYVFNLHPDNFFKYARMKSVALLRQRAQAIVGDCPAIILGDFNADAGSPAYQFLMNGPGLNGRKLLDTFHEANPTWTKNDGTYSGFRGHRDGSRIDWILTTPRFKVLFAGIDHAHDGWRYPSDHFPVMAVLALEPQPAIPAPQVAINVHQSNAGDGAVALKTASPGK